MLIGIVVVAGAVVTSTVLVVMTSEDPLELQIIASSNYRVREAGVYDVRHNSFDLVMQNPGSRGLGFEVGAVAVYIDDGATQLTTWQLEDPFLLQSSQRAVVSVYSTSEWLSRGDELVVTVTGYALDGPSTSPDQVTATYSTIVSGENAVVGPLELVHNQTGVNPPALTVNDPTNNSLQIDVVNYGGRSVSYTVEVLVSNESLSVDLWYSNGTDITSDAIVRGYLVAASPTSSVSTASVSPLQSVTIKMDNATSYNGNYFVYVWLKVGGLIYDSLVVVCELNL